MPYHLDLTILIPASPHGVWLGIGMVWGVTAITASFLGGSLASIKNRNRSAWAACCFFLPPLVIALLLDYGPQNENLDYDPTYGDLGREVAAKARENLRSDKKALRKLAAAARARLSSTASAAGSRIGSAAGSAQGEGAPRALVT